MRGAAFLTLLALGTSVSGLPGPRVEDRAALAPLPTGAVTFPVLNINQALSKLSSKAEATPSAVHFLPDVPLSQAPNGVVHSIVPTSPPAKRFEEPYLDSAPAAPLEAAANQARATCTNPAIVYEWRALTDAHKQQFTAAIKCLYTKPARSGLPNTQNRMDDLAALHQRLTPQIHDDGQFMPWHRYFMWIFEQELRNTCGYAGPMAWWDETKDAGHFSAAPMMTQQYFGHCPDGNSVCIISGVSTGYQLRVGLALLISILAICIYHSAYRPRPR
jgi:Common central domain of tyrosinase